MKVIMSGKDNPNNWSTQKTCTGEGWNQGGKVPCGALLEVSAQDIQKRKHTDYSGETDIYYGFTCPICGCFTEIDKNVIPSSARTNAMEYRRV